MDRRNTTKWMRLLHGELPEAEAREVRDRLRQDPELQQKFEIFEKQWLSLDLPDPEPAPPGFAVRVVTGAQAAADQGLAPAWWSHTLAGKAATASLLAGGIALGSFLASPSEAEDWSEYVTTEPSMAETYLLTMDEPEDGAWQESDS